MAHEITDTDTVATTGAERAWHQLDSRLPDGMTAEEAFTHVGLGWATKLRKMFFQDETGAYVPVDGHQIQTREDNLGQLGIVSDEYQKLDNGDFARFVDSLVGADAALKVETLGSFFGGRRIFCSVKVPRSIEVARDDILEQYLCASMGHGGFAGLNIYPSTVRPVCNNTLRMSERDLGRGISFRHLGDLAEKMKQAQLILGILNREASVFEQRVKALAATQLSEEQLTYFLGQAFVGAFGKMPNEQNEPEAYATMLAKRAATMTVWRENLENERNALPSIRGSAWAAFNSVTEWHDHQRGRESTSVEARTHSNLFGVSHVAKQAAFKSALALVS